MFGWAAEIVGRNRESRPSEAAGRGNSPEAKPMKMNGRKTVAYTVLRNNRVRTRAPELNQRIEPSEGHAFLERNCQMRWRLTRVIAGNRLVFGWITSGLPTTRELAPERKGPEWPVLRTARLFRPAEISSQLCSISTAGTICLWTGAGRLPQS
jgi:hypothetical protein